MAWTVHKPSDCKLGMNHKDNQKKDPNKASSAVVASAATTTISPCYAALLATLANLDEEEWWFVPACIWNVELACMAGPLDTGQQIMTYLFVQFLPIIIFILCHLAYPTKSLATTIHKMAPWRLRGKPCLVWRKRVKKYKRPIRAAKQSQKPNALNLPVPGYFCGLQGWLLHWGFSQTFLGSPYLGPYLPGSSKWNNASINSTAGQIWFWLLHYWSG